MKAAVFAVALSFSPVSSPAEDLMAQGIVPHGYAISDEAHRKMTVLAAEDSALAVRLNVMVLSETERARLEERSRNVARELQRYGYCIELTPCSRLEFREWPDEFFGHDHSVLLH